MPKQYLKRPGRCTRCNAPLHTTCFESIIRYNDTSALYKDPRIFTLRLCFSCVAKLTDRLIDEMSPKDLLDIGQRYGRSTKN